MINYIICDDNKEFTMNEKSIIDKFMMKNDTEYQVHCFNDYTKNFFELIKKELPNKIYILDIEALSASGLDVAREIRKKDYRSIIIFLTSHEELGYTLLQKEYLFLAFINKFDDYETKLVRAIDIAMKKLNCYQMLKYYNNGVYYNIPLDDILYIYKDSIERKCIVKTPYIEIMISKQLNEIKELLNEDFEYSHRSCIVNKSRIRVVNKRKHEIIFDTQDKINLLSNLYKKGKEKNDN